MIAAIILGCLAVILPLCLIYGAMRKALKSTAGRTLKIANLIVGVLLCVVMPSIECVGRCFGGPWGEGEAQVLRVYNLGFDPGFIDSPRVFPLFPNSDLFSGTFAFLGALLLGSALRYITNQYLTIFLLAIGFLLIQMALAIIRFYMPYYDPTVILDLPLLPLFCGYVAGRWPAWNILACRADRRRMG